MSNSAFEFVRSESIPTLNLDVQQFRHRNTGADHYHMASKDTNNAFLVAFRTVPSDSTGVAHILEHTTLCGSEHYPVRDPFFMMIRRSLNTFMNAFTSSDWTAYPFASQNRKDYDNLLQVYLDAVFFPNLHPLDFAQEGHRVEFAKPGDAASELVFKGVVFNEMKGAMSAPVRQVWQTLQSNLFPTTTYHYNSGGEPEDIPNLSYEQLKAFHARHYHPSNAVFMTYGNFPVDEHQDMIEERALSRFERQSLDFSIPDEKRYSESFAIEAAYPLEGEEDTSGKTHIVLGWLLGKGADLRESMNAHLLSSVLLDNSASPLRQTLETTNLASAPSELCGLDDDMREIVFACGVEGSDPDEAEAIEELVMDVIRDVARNGVPRDRVESVLHQLELEQREVGGGRFPYGLQLMLKGLAPALHGGDPMAVLDIDPVLNRLREDIKDDGFIKDLTRRMLLENPHRVRLTMVPDTGMSTRREAREHERLEQIRATMDEADRSRIIEVASRLKARQEMVDNPEILPKVGLEDIPHSLEIPQGSRTVVCGMPATWFGQGTNGLVYEQVAIDLPAMDEASLDHLPLFCECLAEVGCGTLDYLQAQAWQASVSGGIGARTSVRSEVSDTGRVRGLFAMGGKALVRNQSALAELIYKVFGQARFDELPRLRELIAQISAIRETQITGSGHALAMTAASAGLSPLGALAQRWSGLDGIKYVKALNKTLDDKQALGEFAERLAVLRDLIRSAPRQFLTVTESEHRDSVQSALERIWAKEPAPAKNHAPFTLDPVDSRIRQGWATNTQVNFCAKAYPAPPYDHDDATALMVLGPMLRNGFLHRAIREQGGAYGSGAGYNSDTGAFRFFSYRDPRLAETLADFDRSLDWLMSDDAGARELEEAVLNVVSDIDRPESPAGEAIGTFFASLHGRDAARRQAFRARVLEVGLDDLRRAADIWLRPQDAHVAVVSNRQTLDKNASLELEIHHV